MIPEKYYQSQLENSIIREKKLKRILNQVSLMRLVFMVLFILLLVRGINYSNYYILGLSLISVILFFYLVSYHKRKSDERKKNRAIIEINEKELKALKGDYSNFYDGKEFLDSEHEFTYDLDIFGSKSIFQFICRCCTIEGRKKLATQLLNSPSVKEDIYRNQQIHEELSKNPDFIQDYLSTGNIIEVKEREQDQLRSWLKSNKSILPRASHWLAVFLMLLNIGLLVATIIKPDLLNYFIISVLLNWFFYGLFFNAINRYHSEIGKKQEVIKKYNNLSLILVKQSFKNNKLKNHEQIAEKSIKQVKRLGKKIDLFDSRLNMFMGAVLNTLFLLDFHLIFFLERWKKQNRNLLSEVFRIHAEIDAYLSGAVFLFNHPHFTFPEVIDQGFYGKNMGHPLIKHKNCILNDFHFEGEEGIIIITGANMAGKSTFLRTVGLNLILAGCGFPVMAEEFRFERNPVITGMRTTDSIAESESYFFAELKRLKRIMDRLRNNERLYVFLDEILKGTNSIDKHKGSEELLKQISNYNSKLFIATYDLKLGKLENKYPEKIKNYHFESFIKDEELSFDYKLRTGVAVNMNASFLLKKMEILKK